MKKLMALLLAGVMAMSMTACSGGDEGSSTADSGAGSDYKIAIITGTVSQGEEEFRAAENLKAADPDKYVTATYPDNFAKETETTISNVVNLVSDPDVKGLVFLQAVPGGAAAVAKAREINPDLIVVMGVMQEDPQVTSDAADIVLNTDEVAMGNRIPEQAAAMGAKTLVHYSFPRHLGMQTISNRLDLIRAKCEELGITLVEASAPDPLGDSGVTGTQQFILEDVPKKVAEYGKDTAFFATNCGMQEPLIKSVAEQGAILPQQCCPSPYHGYPGAFGIEIPDDKAGDVDYILSAIDAKVVEAGEAGRMATWPVPVNMLLVEAGTKYIDGRLDGSITDENELEQLKAICTELAGADITMGVYNDGTKDYDNIYTVLVDYYTFGTENGQLAGTASEPETADQVDTGAEDVPADDVDASKTQPEA